MCRIHDGRSDRQIWADLDERELAAPPKLYYDGRAGGNFACAALQAAA